MSVMEPVARQGSFASWLLAELVERKKLPADLARALGARPSTVSSWTNPKKPVTPNPYYAVAIAKFLGVVVGMVGVGVDVESGKWGIEGRGNCTLTDQHPPQGRVSGPGTCRERNTSTVSILTQLPECTASEPA